MPVTRHALALWVVAGCCLSARTALAFENQWHLGAGLGTVAYVNNKQYQVPTLSLHGAYGVSDVFDARLEAGAGLPVAPAKSGSSLEYAEAIMAYKVDIIEWIPWVGLGAGVFGATGGFQGYQRHAVQPAAGLWLGMDYAFAREWGVGAAVAVHSWFLDSGRHGLRLAANQFVLRVERRFGW